MTILPFISTSEWSRTSKKNKHEAPCVALRVQQKAKQVSCSWQLLEVLQWPEKLWFSARGGLQDAVRTFGQLLRPFAHPGLWFTGQASPKQWPVASSWDSFEKSTIEKLWTCNLLYRSQKPVGMGLTVFFSNFSPYCLRLVQGRQYPSRFMTSEQPLAVAAAQRLLQRKGGVLEQLKSPYEWPPVCQAMENGHRRSSKALKFQQLTY